MRHLEAPALRGVAAPNLLDAPLPSLDVGV